MIDGILIRKTPYQERHLIGNLLLRNGKTLSVLFFGGLGGGKNKKPSHLELGNLISLPFAPDKNYQNLVRAKEWKITWSSQKIRESYRKFSSLCFIVEVMSKITVDEDTKGLSIDNNEFDGLFKVLSNACFFLDLEENFQEYQISFLSYFLGKLFIDLGIFPDINQCQISGKKLGGNILLRPDLGGLTLLEEDSSGGKIFTQTLPTLSFSAYSSWKENKWKEVKNSPRELLLELLDYLSFQVGVDLKLSLKTLSSII